MDSAPVSKKRHIIAGLAVLIVITVIVASLTLGKKDETAADTTTSTTSAAAADTSTTATATTDSATTTYKDGDYTATGSYNSPGGNEEITISLTLKDGVVTATSAQAGATSGDAKFYQSDFIAAYKELVVGKKIDDLSLSRVAGASLTTNGFNDALDQIQTDARA